MQWSVNQLTFPRAEAPWGLQNQPVCRGVHFGSPEFHLIVNLTFSFSTKYESCWQKLESCYLACCRHTTFTISDRASKLGLFVWTNSDLERQIFCRCRWFEEGNLAFHTVKVQESRHTFDRSHRHTIGDRSRMTEENHAKREVPCITCYSAPAVQLCQDVVALEKNRFWTTAVSLRLRTASVPILKSLDSIRILLCSHRRRTYEDLCLISFLYLDFYCCLFRVHIHTVRSGWFSLFSAEISPLISPDPAHCCLSASTP